MLGLILLVLSFLLFLGAALNQTFFEQAPADLVAFGLAAWVLAVMVGTPFVTDRLKRGE